MRQLNPSSQFSAFDIRKNSCKADEYYHKAQQQIQQLPFGFISVSSQDTIDCLLQKLQHHVTQHPTIIIDYLQIIPHVGELKRMLDNDIPKLKQFQQSTGSTFILISSTNRASYRADMGMEAFKESGVIEFSADVIWMLQYSVLNSLKTIDNTRLKLEKSRSPRKMTLKCLKNRFGNCYDVNFDYYSKFDLFIEQRKNDESLIDEEA